MSDVEQDFQRFLHPDRQAEPAERIHRAYCYLSSDHEGSCQAAPAEPTNAAYDVIRNAGIKESMVRFLWDKGYEIRRIEAEARQPSPVAERSPGLREALGDYANPEVRQAAREKINDAASVSQWFAGRLLDVIDRAALATDPAAQPEPLDVERLAKVLEEIDPAMIVYFAEGDWKGTPRKFAQAIAAAYASRPAEEQGMTHDEMVASGLHECASDCQQS